MLRSNGDLTLKKFGLKGSIENANLASLNKSQRVLINIAQLKRNLNYWGNPLGVVNNVRYGKLFI